MFPNKNQTLVGQFIKLIPMQIEHSKGLFDLAKGADLWRWYPTRVQNHQDMKILVEEALQEKEKGLCLPFTIIDLQTQNIVGSSRFFNISTKVRRLEIGWTWIAPPFQKTYANPESKLLMLEYAFETLGCVRVELKTDSRNLQSQAAMSKLGLVKEGTLRSHMMTFDGHHRDTVYFSVIKCEWPQLRDKLKLRLSQ